MCFSGAIAGAKVVELHQTTMTAEGVMQMREVKKGLPIAAGATLELWPGGNHLMVMGLDEALADGASFRSRWNSQSGPSRSPCRCAQPANRRRTDAHLSQGLMLHDS